MHGANSKHSSTGHSGIHGEQVIGDTGEIGEIGVIGVIGSNCSLGASIISFQ